jgi:hypothetical protein
MGKNSDDRRAAIVAAQAAREAAEREARRQAGDLKPEPKPRSTWTRPRGRPPKLPQ